MTIPKFGGCLWPVDPACFGDDWEAMDQPTQDRGLAYASATLERLTGRRVGNCPIKVRPVPQRGACFVPGSYSDWLYPGMNVNGNWVNNCGYYLDGGAVAAGALALPFPIGRVDQVKINGTVVTSNHYRVQSSRYLRFDNTVTVPTTQDLTKDDTQPGTFSVTYLNAWPVDALGANAAALLAIEFAKACAGKKCALPTGVTQIVRQGVSMTIASGAFPGGETGLRTVDTYIALWNPKHLKQGASVWTPDQPQVAW